VAAQHTGRFQQLSQRVVRPRAAGARPTAKPSALGGKLSGKLGTRPRKKPAAPGRKPRSAAARTSASAKTARSWVGSAGRALAMAVAFVAMVAFAMVLARATLEPSAASAGIAHANLTPGASLRQYIERYTAFGAAKQIGGNLLLGLPFGLLLPVLAPNARGLARVVVITALVMILVELAQGAMVEGRAFDIDDVILNTTGALLGYVLLGRRLGRAVHVGSLNWGRRRVPRRP
jgi:VanZ family protein